MTENQYSLTNRYKLLVYITAKNNDRCIEFAKQFANNLYVYYLTLDTNRIEELYNPNIKIYDLSSPSNVFDRLVIKYNFYKVSKQIESYIKANNIYKREILLILTETKFSTISESFPLATMHFDFDNSISTNIYEDMLNNNLFILANSITTNNLRVKNDLENNFDAIYRLPDGINNNIKTNSKCSSLPAFSSPLIGCFSSNPEILDIDFINELSKSHPEYTFLFLSDKNFPEEFKTETNLNFITTRASFAKYNLVLLPFNELYCAEVNTLLYENLIYHAPIVSLKTQELETHKRILYLYKSKSFLNSELSDLNKFINPDLLQKSLLLDNCSWNARFKQLESIILAHR
ncbi:MAG: hypothetical protein AB1782_03220 [Cyanobacteriota bacterium]